MECAAKDVNQWHEDAENDASISNIRAAAPQLLHGFGSESEFSEDPKIHFPLTGEGRLKPQICWEELKIEALRVYKEEVLENMRTDINISHILHSILKQKRVVVDVAPDVSVVIGMTGESIGSALHEHGICKPCVFANKANKKCRSGHLCLFCHNVHKEKRRRLKKNKSRNGMTLSPHSCGDSDSTSFRTPFRDSSAENTVSLPSSGPASSRPEVPEAERYTFQEGAEYERLSKWETETFFDDNNPWNVAATWTIDRAPLPCPISPEVSGPHFEFPGFEEEVDVEDCSVSWPLECLEDGGSEWAATVADESRGALPTLCGSPNGDVLKSSQHGCWKPLAQSNEAAPSKEWEADTAVLMDLCAQLLSMCSAQLQSHGAP